MPWGRQPSTALECARRFHDMGLVVIENLQDLQGVWTTCPGRQQGGQLPRIWGKPLSQVARWY